ncbi:MAG TPA: 4Fe-4S dicluster domain-containing protein [Opitutaceae bacterium]|nr:4Fe-4S dicluster domain-containing protein [Opitutaceae bacterium]
MPPENPIGPHEFPAGASEWPAGLSRRQFIELMAASLALAGLGACNRPPDKTIVPYVTPPDRDLVDGALYYATALPWEGYARGVLALSRSGRPTKIEGNPAHPDSLGATDALTQASVLSLYDPDRSRTPRRGGQPVAWSAFEDAWLARHRELLAQRGAGFALLTEPTTSLTELRGIHALLDRFPAAHWYQHTPLARYDRDGMQDDYDFVRADIVLALDTDFLLSHPSSLRYTRAFASRRRLERGRVNANRLYVIEPSLTITGSMADHRLPASPARMRALLTALTDLIEGKEAAVKLAENERRVLATLARDLREKAPRVVCLASPHGDPALHAWAAATNARLGAAGVTHHALPAVRSDGDARCAGDLAALTMAMQRGDVNTLAIVGANPAYTAPGELEFPAALKRVALSIHLGSHADETAALCAWHLPESHALESWSDLRAYDGTASIVQPLIAPMYLSKSAAEFLFFLADPPVRDGYELVRDTWRQDRADDASFDAAWSGWLRTGAIENSAAARTRPRTTTATPLLSPALDARALTVLFRPDPTIRDGRWSNNAWLQELPKPLTHLVWDNAAQISPSFAAAQHLENGYLIEVRVNGRAIAAPVWITPGHASDCLTLTLGYGRTHAGSIGNGLGYDAYRLRTHAQLWHNENAAVAKLGRQHPLVSTQTHFAMEGRDLVRVADAAHLVSFAVETPPSLYPDVAYRDYKWGMSIDLGACTGCTACVVACQAENNIPVVGRDQVARGREMHWLRVDTYYAGVAENPRVLHQPVPCMQCENAPCEIVCPVAATVHSAEGLNDMVYNRCIGTRYCSNNCPYKVRRFNFLDYRAPRDSTVHLQQNPDVTVRARGVMEKCTYCVQRIDARRIAAEKENRRVRDGEIRTACQQACPAEAIVFGDLNDPQASVVARKAEPTNYALLGELNTRPRTTYLARLVNREESA